jgi:phage terminase large subunit-like protein
MPALVASPFCWKNFIRRGLAQPQIGTDLYAGDGLLMFWSHEPVAPWQTEDWLAQMRRQLRPNQYLRMIENRWVSNEDTFVDMVEWDRCVDPDAKPVLEAKGMPVWVAVDASTKHDASVVLACSYDHDERKARLINHRVFQPTPDRPLNFEATIEQMVKEYCDRYHVLAVYYDPWQMTALAQRLRAFGCPMAEFPQTVPNLTAPPPRTVAIVFIYTSN